MRILRKQAGEVVSLLWLAAPGTAIFLKDMVDGSCLMMQNAFIYNEICCATASPFCHQYISMDIST